MSGRNSSNSLPSWEQIAGRLARFLEPHAICLHHPRRAPKPGCAFCAARGALDLYLAKTRQFPPERRVLGTELRRLRRAAGMTQEQTARRLERSDSWLSRVESGQIPAHSRDVRDLLDLYGITDQATRERLLSTTRTLRPRR